MPIRYKNRIGRESYKGLVQRKKKGENIEDQRTLIWGSIRKKSQSRKINKNTSSWIDPTDWKTDQESQDTPYRNWKERKLEWS